MDIAAWLRGLGLEQYAPAFRDNDVDGEVLPELTADDLIGLGVNSIGHRRKLLAAIAVLGAEPVTVAQSAASATSASTSPPTIDAERRQLTVMFCDLVGSTALSSRLDPEDLREVIGAYHRAVAEIVAGFDGFVAKYMGDGVLVYFGYPRAHEDDAERAVRAGLGTIGAVGRLDIKSTKLQARVGIATGLVVVGDLIGEGSAQEQAVVGETPNLAARLQALATPASLVIAASTRQQIGELFDLEDLGPQVLAGFADPQPAWRVIGESGMLSRFEALRSGTTPLVGRAEELDLLLLRWEQAKTGEGRVVLLSGEPGIGKSRLTAALNEHIADEPHTRLRYFCSPYHQETAFHPVVVQLERAAGFARHDAAEEKLVKLRTLLEAGARGDDEIALVADLLSLLSSAADLNLSPQRKREKLLEALLGQLEAVARSRPVLMVFEDAHWIDPTSRELLDLTVDRVCRLPALLVITFRPEFQPPWGGGRSYVTSLALNRLGERDGEALVQTLAGDAPLDAEIVAEIVERTDGVPLFVEELTKAVLESAAQGDRVAAVLGASSAATLTIPATLHASLIARLDRLGTAPKEVAQIGAVLGREFTYELIEPVAQRSEAELQAALERLTDAGLLFCRGVAPHSFYIFKHALVQDAAYSTLLRARRMQLHGRIVDTLESQFAQTVASQPQLIAHHCTEAGRPEQALGYRIKAAQLAAARSAMREAEAQLRKGLDLLAHLPEGSAREKHELELHIALARTLIATQGHAAPEVAEVQARARQLWERLGQPPEAWMSNQFEYRLTRAELALARQEAQEVIDRGKSGMNPRTTITGCNMSATVSFFRGDFASSCAYGQEALDLFDANLRNSSDRGAIYGQTVARSYRFLSKFYLGYLDQALTQCQETQAAARGHAFSLALAMACGLNMQSEPAARAMHCEELEAHAVGHGFPIFAAHATVFRGSALSALGRPEEGLELLKKGLAAYRATGAVLQVPGFLTELAEGCGRCGRANEGLDHLEEAAQLIERTDERWTEAYVLCTRGDLLIAVGEAERGEGSLKEAIAVARRQDARLWELRAATSLARLWREQGKISEARNLLAPVCGWFAEGLDTRDLSQANSLLQQLV